MLCALLHFGKLKGIDILLEFKVWYTGYIFERLHFVNWVKNRNEPLCICTCIMVIDNCCVIRRTFAFLLFKFMQGLILLVQACTVSKHPQTTLKK